MTSTMELAAEQAEADAPSGTVIVADFQSRGRGTRGRQWLAPPGSALMFTILGRPDMAAEDLEHLPLRVANAVATVLHARIGLECVIKPPNDLLVGGRKLCGVLCTSRIVGSDARWVLAGIGLNTAMTADQLPLDTATSLLVEGFKVPPADAMLEWLLEELEFLR